MKTQKYTLDVPPARAKRFSGMPLEVVVTLDDGWGDCQTLELLVPPGEASFSFELPAHYAAGPPDEVDGPGFSVGLKRTRPGSCRSESYVTALRAL